MTYEEFKRQLGRAGLKTREFADLMKLNPNSITNYSKREDVPSHLAVIAALMAEMAQQGLDIRSTISRIQIQPNKPRGGGINGQFGGSKQADMFPVVGGR